MVILLKNGCSVGHMFCTIFVPLSETKMLEKHVRSSSYLVQAFFTFAWKYYFYHSSFIPNFLNRYFQKSYFLSRIEKSTKFINENLNLARNCGRSNLLENYVFTDNYFTQDRLRNSKFYRVSLADLYALLINAFE